MSDDSRNCRRNESNASTTLALRRSDRGHPRALRLPHPVEKGVGRARESGAFQRVRPRRRTFLRATERPGWFVSRDAGSTSTPTFLITCPTRMTISESPPCCRQADARTFVGTDMTIFSTQQDSDWNEVIAAQFSV